MAGTPLLVQCVPSGMTKKLRMMNLAGVHGEVDVIPKEIPAKGGKDKMDYKLCKSLAYH